MRDGARRVRPPRFRNFSVSPSNALKFPASIGVLAFPWRVSVATSTDQTTRILNVVVAALGGAMTIEGVEQGRGKGADVLGHPLNALAWLADNRVERGRPLRQGMVVLTGSIVSTKWPKAGQTVNSSIEGLGEAVARFV